MNKKRNFLRSAGLISAATMVSRVLGLVREQVFAFFFGAGLITDAFQIAFRIPNLLRDLFAEGAMSFALVPIYIESRKKDGDNRAWELARKLICLLGVTLFSLAALGIYFAEEIVMFFPLEVGSRKFELTVGLTRVMIPFLPTVVLAAIWMSLLNAREKFGVPALAPALFNVASIFAAFAICPWMPSVGLEPIYGMAFGVLLGGLGQWLIQTPALRKEGFRFRFNFNWKDKELGRIAALMGIGAVGAAATQVNVLVNSFLALSHGDGAVSWLNYAFRLLQFPIGVFGVAIAQVTLTKVSKSVANSNLDEVGESVLKSLRMAFVITIPSAIGLAMLGKPIISVIFEHGQFSYSDVSATAWALMLYSIGLVAYASNKILVPVLYSLKKARIAVGSTVLVVFINVLLCIRLSAEMGFAGLALATALSAYIHWSILLFSVLRYSQGFKWGSFIQCVLSAAGAGLAMGALLYFGWDALAIHWQILNFFTRLGLLTCGILIGAGTYWACCRLFGVAEVAALESFVLQKIARARNRGS